MTRKPAVGERWYDEHGPVRVMAIKDKWIMARRPGCIPFTVYASRWNSLFQDVPRGAADDGAGTKPGQ